MKDHRVWRAMTLVTTISSYLVGPTLLGIFLGMWIDNKMNTLPIFLLVFLFIGLGAGVYSTYRLIKQFESGER
ncbi:MAG: AtpZ/AtpI family protein [Bacillaceae bacterium]